ncbi:MAG: S1 RNA-binding domain-containing protein [Clostridia bacterium]
MQDNFYKSEGSLIKTKDNIESLGSIASLTSAMQKGKILEAIATMCDSEHNLIIDLPFCKGIIKREDAAIGIDDGSVRDIAIITRVNKPVCFVVKEIIYDDINKPIAILSRKDATKKARDYIFKNKIVGDVIEAKITHLEPFGAFADIGCGNISLMTIDNISISRISHPADRFTVGQNINVVIKEMDFENFRISITHKELLGTWQENADKFSAGQTVGGIIRSIESYGVFIELTPNLAGLAEFKEGLYKGQSTAVYIKSIIPEKMKIKLTIIDAYENNLPNRFFDYDNLPTHIDEFVYSPPCCKKQIFTIF